MNIAKILRVRSSEMTAQEIPENRMDRIHQTFRRRLSDSLEEALHRACADHDLRTAYGVFAVLEDFHSREDHDLHADRRISDDILNKARALLDRCREQATGVHLAA